MIKSLMPRIVGLKWCDKITNVELMKRRKEILAKQMRIRHDCSIRHIL